MITFHILFCKKAYECRIQQNILQLNKKSLFLTSDQVSKLKLKLIFQKIGSDYMTQREHWTVNDHNIH